MPESPIDLDDGPRGNFYLWPENEPAWRFFLRISTQWRHGQAGPTGLDHGALEEHLRRYRPSRSRASLRELMYVMERGAIQGFVEARQQRERELDEERQRMLSAHRLRR